MVFGDVLYVTSKDMVGRVLEWVNQVIQHPKQVAPPFPKYITFQKTSTSVKLVRGELTFA